MVTTFCLKSIYGIYGSHFLPLCSPIVDESSMYCTPWLFTQDPYVPPEKCKCTPGGTYTPGWESL